MNFRLSLVAAAVVALAAPAHSQTAATARAPRVEVTGSMIKRVDAETPLPVLVITREDIERSGATSIDELMRMNSASGAGSLNDMDAGNGFAAGTASISLRGMGSTATLRLVNGRRLTPAAVVAPTPVSPPSSTSTPFRLQPSSASKF